MFAVIFELHPHAAQFDGYLDIAKALRPELEAIDGFIDNVRYRSLTRPGTLLSLSSWRDEKALVRWRTQVRHNGAQQQGRGRIFSNYHLRVGQFTHDTHLPAGHALRDQRLDETEIGEATTVTLRSGERPSPDGPDAEAIARAFGCNPHADGLIAWDAFEAILTPGDVIVLMSWRDRDAAGSASAACPSPSGLRARTVRIIRDYGMFDRREAPQFYPDAPGRDTVRA